MTTRPSSSTRSRAIHVGDGAPSRIVLADALSVEEHPHGASESGIPVLRTIVDELVYGHELQRRDAEALEVLDHSGLDDAGVGASELLGDVGVPLRESLHVRLVAMPDEGIHLGEGHAGLRAVLIEQSQLDALGAFAEEREVRALTVEGRPEWIRGSRPDLAAHPATGWLRMPVAMAPTILTARSKS